MTESEAFIARAIEDNFKRAASARDRGDFHAANRYQEYAERWVLSTGIDPRHPGQKDKASVNDAPMVYAHINF